MARACRICDAPLSVTFCDLGESPFSNDYLTPAQLASGMERFYPLHVYVCDVCLLVQLESFEPPERIFSDHYLYFSSFSSSWVSHAREYAAKMKAELNLEPSKSLVMEIASNDGYLLQHFVEMGIDVLGVEPAANVAEAARAKGVRTEVAFFGAKTAERLRSAYGPADVIAANNVLAHVPDLHDFIEGFRVALAPQGTATFEFPHLLRLVEEVQFDTIYHEHFSYFSLPPLVRAFGEHELEIVHVEELPTHGGSLRIHIRHRGVEAPRPSVEAVRAKEIRSGLDELTTYRAFQSKVEACKVSFLTFLANARRDGKSIAGYGAPAKGNTFLNYCGVGSDEIAFTVDRSPHKQGHLLPGSHIPILSPDAIVQRKPDYVLVLPWNLLKEIREQMSVVETWGGRFVVAIPLTTLV